MSSEDPARSGADSNLDPALSIAAAFLLGGTTLAACLALTGAVPIRPHEHNPPASARICCHHGRRHRYVEHRCLSSLA